MLPFPVDIVGVFGCYFIVMMVYNAVLQSGTHSISARIFSSIVTYIFIGFLLDYFLNLIIVTVALYTTAEYVTAFSWIFQVYLAGVFVRWYAIRPEKLNVDEMKNFMRTALVFGNYFRLKDVDTREMIGAHKMKTLYKEVHGKEFTEDVIATPFDQLPTTFKKVSIEELNAKKKNYPPEYFEEIKRLNLRQTTDVSVSFRFELAKIETHSFIPYMVGFSIDPLNKILSVAMDFPSDKKIPIVSGAERTRLVERIYESLHFLIAHDWFLLYVPHISTIVVSCNQKILDDTMIEISRPLLTFSIPYQQLHRRSTRITTVSEIERIAQIHFL